MEYKGGFSKLNKNDFLTESFLEKKNGLKINVNHVTCTPTKSKTKYVAFGIKQKHPLIVLNGNERHYFP